MVRTGRDCVVAGCAFANAEQIFAGHSNELTDPTRRRLRPWMGFVEKSLKALARTARLLVLQSLVTPQLIVTGCH